MNSRPACAIGSHYVAHAGPKVVILLPLSSHIGFTSVSYHSQVKVLFKPNFRAKKDSCVFTNQHAWDLITFFNYTILIIFQYQRSAFNLCSHLTLES